MKFKFDPRAGRMVGSRTQILQRHEIERLGGVIPDNRHISPGTAYIPEKDVMRVKAAARMEGVEVTRLNGYDKDIGGGLYRFEKTTTFESRKDMKINENTKVTLTLGQLKRLVKEAKIKDRNNNSITVDDSQLTIILKGTEQSRNVNRSGFCRRMWVFHSLDSAVKFCDKTHIGCDGVETIIVHNKGKTEERGPFFDGEVMGTTNNWDKVKKIIETLVNEVKD